MPRDHRKLRVFRIADQLIVDIYEITKVLPVEERYGLQSQIRRAALSTATNIVEGCARRTDREYGNFLNIATGSAAEAGYLLTVAARLHFISPAVAQSFDPRYRELIGSLVRLVGSIKPDNEMHTSPRPLEPEP